MVSVVSSINGFLLTYKAKHKQLKLIRIYLLEISCGDTNILYADKNIRSLELMVNQEL